MTLDAADLRPDIREFVVTTKDVPGGAIVVVGAWPDRISLLTDDDGCLLCFAGDEDAMPETTT